MRKRNKNDGAFKGLVIGSVLFFLMLVVVTVFCIVRMNKSNSVETPTHVVSAITTEYISRPSQTIDFSQWEALASTTEITETEIITSTEGITETEAVDNTDEITETENVTDAPEVLETTVFEEEITSQEIVTNTAIEIPQPVTNYKKFVFLGDSRYKGMSKYAQADDVFIAEISMGYDYLIEQTPNLLRECDSESALIIGLGINDPGNVIRYIAAINELGNQLPCDIYFMSVNPVDEEAEKNNNYHTFNSDVDEFNRTMKSGLHSRIYYIDTNAYIDDAGFESPDGIHYSSWTYQSLYNFIKDYVKAYKALEQYR